MKKAVMRSLILNAGEMADTIYTGGPIVTMIMKDGKVYKNIIE